MYSNAPSGARAGLVVLIFALIISFVSAAPIPVSVSQSGLSSNQDLIHGDTPKVPAVPVNGPISTVSVTARAFTVNNTPVEFDNHLVRRSIGSKIKAAFQRFGRTLKRGFQKIGAGIKKVAQKIGHGIVTAAKKVGTFVKKTAGKIAKFGLKILATAAEIGGKIIGFIPGGKIIGKALDGAAKGLDIASDKIHANLGSKLEKGMKVMDKIGKITSYIPRELSAEDGF
jgi:hypothetical protein